MILNKTGSYQVKKDCNCWSCPPCKGVGRTYDKATMLYSECTNCKGTGAIKFCFEHIKKFLDYDDKKRYESYQRRSA